MDESILALLINTGLVRCHIHHGYIDPNDQQATVIDERPVCGKCAEET